MEKPFEIWRFQGVFCRYLMASLESSYELVRLAWSELHDFDWCFWDGCLNQLKTIINRFLNHPCFWMYYDVSSSKTVKVNLIQSPHGKLMLMNLPISHFLNTLLIPSSNRSQAWQWTILCLNRFSFSIAEKVLSNSYDPGHRWQFYFHPIL